MINYVHVQPTPGVTCERPWKIQAPKIQPPSKGVHHQEGWENQKLRRGSIKLFSLYLRNNSHNCTIQQRAFALLGFACLSQLNTSVNVLCTTKLLTDKSFTLAGCLSSSKAKCQPKPRVSTNNMSCNSVFSPLST